MENAAPQPRNDHDAASKKAFSLRQLVVPLLIDGASLGSYLFACTLPTINEWRGFDLLLVGWYEILALQFGWLANPFLWAGWFLVMKRRFGRATALGAIAFILGLHTFTLTGYTGFAVHQPVWGFDIGVYVWLGSIAVFVLGAALAGYAPRLLSAKPVAFGRQWSMARVLGGTGATLLLAAIGYGLVSNAGGVALDPHPPAGRIVFWREDFYQRQAIDAGGTNLAQFAEPGDLSPDGVHVAISANSIAHYGRLCLQKKDGGSETCFEGAASPEWSPDGSRLVFEQEPNRTLVNPPGTLMLVNADGSGLTRLGDGDNPRWSPDGRLIFYSKSERGLYTGFIMHPDGTDAGRLPGAFTSSIRWSPDHQRMVYYGGGGSILVSNADGTGAREIAKGDFPVWSPNGRQIAFKSPTDISFDQIFVVNPDGTRLTQLTSGRISADFPVWSPDGKHIAFIMSSLKKPPQIYIVHPDGSGMRPVTQKIVQRRPLLWVAQ